MSSGFFAQNGAGQVLVSDRTKNLHFLGKATQTSVVSNAFGGGRFIWVFQITSVRPPVPFFTAHSNMCAITSIKQLGANWEITIIRAGTDPTPPEVYVFTDPIGWVPTETHGMIVRNELGEVTFDSRFKPLSINWSSVAIAPARPFSNGIGAVGSNLSTAMGQQTYSNGMSEQFRPKNTLVVGSAPVVTKPLLSFSALMQSEAEAGFADELTSGGKCSSDRTTTYYRTLIWGFYRSGVSYASGNVNSGWLMVSNGGFTTSVRNTFDQVSQSSNTTGRAQYGVPPLSNETINTGYSIVMLTDGSLYD